jgi:murein DD-endopeptidase MepM/ murein hydrolase activator NlpD
MTRASLLAAALLLSACHRDDNRAPTAAFEATQPAPDQVTTYAFSAAASHDSDGTITSHSWDFGDGAASTAAAPTHVYAASGTYTVKLTVTDDDGASASATRTVEITTPAATANAGTAAATLALPQLATVQVPQAAFAVPTQVGVWATSRSVTAADFDLTAQLFSSALRARQELRVNTGKQKPAAPITVSAVLPAELLARMGERDEPQVFVQVFQDGGDEVLDSFELVPAVYDAAGKTLRFDLAPDMFTDRRSSDESWEAVFVVGATRSRPAPAAAPVRDASGAAAGTEALRPWPALAVAGPPVAGAQDATLADAAASSCDGATLRPPLADLTVTGAYNSPRHYGIDYRAADGTEVRSMADGTVSNVGFDERPLTRPDPRSGKRVKGWGHYVVIAHSDGSKSLYAHLQAGDIRVAVGETVASGQAIALSDNSGGSQASHLHVEYAPNGEIFKRGSKTDPHACIGNDITGAIQVSDNGPVADDAFVVSINGRPICATTIGASNRCSTGPLRSGTASLSITTTIAPDDVGTYGITLGDGITFQDASTSVSGTLPQGATASFPITVP